MSIMRTTFPTVNLFNSNARQWSQQKRLNRTKRPHQRFENDWTVPINLESKLLECARHNNISEKKKENKRPSKDDSSKVFFLSIVIINGFEKTSFGFHVQWNRGFQSYLLDLIEELATVWALSSSGESMSVQFLYCKGSIDPEGIGICC